MPPEDFFVKHQVERNALSPAVRRVLLKDRTSRKNIIWATEDYKILGNGYGFGDEMTPDALSLNDGSLIQPRVLKGLDQKGNRTREKAEVFTPSWVCNAQNNLVDNAWFGRENVFNIEIREGWETVPEKIDFPDKKNKTWKHYVDLRRMEITCGEAPYLVSRYDTVSGQPIPVPERIGLLDRKLRVVGENVEAPEDWLFWALRAVESCYGYEWQGDSLFLARENVLLSVMDYYADRFGFVLDKKQQRTFAKRISWNLWQMDALKGVIPGSCHDELENTTPPFYEMSGDEDTSENKFILRPCPGCSTPKKQHNGIYCRVYDWRSKLTKRYIDFLG